MSARGRRALAAREADPAPVFAALGDQTRLSLLKKLGDGHSRSIAELAEGSKFTRQAITKHLKVLECAGVVRSMRSGRENLFELKTEPIDEARKYLDAVSEQWDQALARLKSFVES